jgi:hypothetical protein
VKDVTVFTPFDVTETSFNGGLSTSDIRMEILLEEATVWAIIVGDDTGEMRAYQYLSSGQRVLECASQHLVMVVYRSDLFEGNVRAEGVVAQVGSPLEVSRVSPTCHRRQRSRPQRGDSHVAAELHHAAISVNLWGSSNLHALVTYHVLDRQPPADCFEVIADRANLRAIEITALDLGDLALPDTDPLRQLRLCEASLLA